MPSHKPEPLDPTYVAVPEPVEIKQIHDIPALKIDPKAEHTILHQSIGLNVRINSKNKFCVATLHHTADPRKRSEEWRAEAAAGMSPAKFSREYDIDYGALFGERVFPEVVMNRGSIVVAQPYPSFPADQVYWGGFDYGLRNPSAFHVYTYYDGVLYCIWELYEPCKNIIEFAAKILACPYYGSIRAIASDPSIAALRHFGKDGNGASIRDQFFEQGVTKLALSSSDEAAWLGQMRRHWSNPEDPTFRIFDSCPMLLWELERAVYAGIRDIAATRNPKEAIADVNNHALDACKYMMLYAPRPQQRKDIKFPIMVRQWAK
jgi:hypothetical protein